MLAAIPREAAMPFRSRATIERRRDRRLQELIHYAYASVPQYHDLMNELGLQPDDIRTPEDLAKLPPITDEAMCDDPRRFVSNRVDLARCDLFRSGGTTGVEKQVYYDRLSLLMNVAYSERQERVFRHFTSSRFRQRQLIINTQGAVTNKIRGLYRRRLRLLAPIGPQRERIEIRVPFGEQIEALNRIRPEMLYGYGGFIGEFLARVHRESIPIHRPKLVVMGGEMLRADHRRLIEEEMGIPVVMTYQSTESLKIGFECEHRQGYHLHEDLCIVRLLDEGGSPTPDGEVGHVHITNLINRATLLINFDQSDRGRIIREPCACGRTLRRLELIEARQWPMLRTFDGRIVHYADISRMLKEDTTIDRVQVIVDRPDLWTVVYVCPSEALPEEWRRRMLQAIEGPLAGPGIQIRLEQRDAPERTEGGKWSPVLIRCWGEAPYETR